MESNCIDKAWLEAHPEFKIAEAKVRHPLDRAHPYPPGSGPPGQTCGTCAKLCRRHGSQKTYFKCHVLAKFWTAGPATDLRMKDPACIAWEPRVDKVEPITTRQRHRPGFPQLAPASPMRRRLKTRRG